MHLETNRMLIYATRKHMENIMLREKSKLQKTTYLYIIPLLCNVWNRQMYMEENRLDVVEGCLEGSGRTQKVFTHSVGLVVFKYSENVLKLIVVMDGLNTSEM